MASVGLVGVIALSVPGEYFTEGRFGTVIWHRVTESFGADPAWPYPGINDMFDCAEHIPQGIQPGFPDSNGHCMWWDYVKRHNIPAERSLNQTHSGLYETALRGAFFRIVKRYPGQTLKAFLYYKPRYIVSSIAKSLRANFSGHPAKGMEPGQDNTGPYSRFAIRLLIAALLLPLAYFSLAPMPGSDMRRIGGLSLLAGGCAILPLIAAWALPATAADLLFYCLFLVGLGLGSALAAARAAIWPTVAVAATD